MSDVEIRESQFDGLGLFATGPFRAGQRIREINIVREVTPTSPLREDLRERADHCDYPNGKVVLLGTPDRHVNHSCDPNAYVVYEDERSFLVARRHISRARRLPATTTSTSREALRGLATVVLRGAGAPRWETSSSSLSTSSASTGRSSRTGSCAHSDRLRALGIA